jgi:hypothetical protein
MRSLSGLSVDMSHNLLDVFAMIYPPCNSEGK